MSNDFKKIEQQMIRTELLRRQGKVPLEDAFYELPEEHAGLPESIEEKFQVDRQPSWVVWLRRPTSAFIAWLSRKPLLRVAYALPLVVLVGIVLAVVHRSAWVSPDEELFALATADDGTKGAVDGKEIFLVTDFSQTPWTPNAVAIGAAQSRVWDDTLGGDVLEMVFRTKAPGTVTLGFTPTGEAANSRFHRVRFWMRSDSNDPLTVDFQLKVAGAKTSQLRLREVTRTWRSFTITIPPYKANPTAGQHLFTLSWSLRPSRGPGGIHSLYLDNVVLEDTKQNSRSGTQH